jgi:hypothetical protein
MRPRPVRSPPRRGIALLFAGVVLASVLGSARAQTPDEVLCWLGWGDNDPEIQAACSRCYMEKNQDACMCAALPRVCVKTKLALAVQVQLEGARVEGARVTIAAGGATLERTTDASGDARFEVPNDPARPPKVIVKSVGVSQATKLPGLVFASGSKTFTVALDREVPVAKGDTSKRFALALPSAKLVVTAVSRDPKTGAWAPARARAEFFLAKEKVFATDAGPDTKTIPLLVPPSEVGKDYRVQGATIDGTKLRDTTSVRIPAPGATAFLTLYLGDLMTQLERARFKLKEMLTQAYGPEIAGRIVDGVRFELGDYATPSYGGGVLRIPANYTLGSASEMENIFHEWGHRVQDVLAPDLRASFSVGGRTEGPWANDPDNNGWRAFDEARANFYAQLFTASLRYPGDKSYNEATAKPFVGKCSTCPGYLAAAMVTHYRDPTLYKNALEIARDVREVHDEAVRSLGHAPRTYAEFVKAKESLIDRQRAEGRIPEERANAVKKQLRDTNARFKL